MQIEKPQQETNDWNHYVDYVIATQFFSMPFANHVWLIEIRCDYSSVSGTYLNVICLMNNTSKNGGEKIIQ